MSRIVATGIAFPPYDVTQDEISVRVGAWLESRGRDPERVLGIFANAGVGRRHSVLPLDDLFEPRGMGARSDAYALAAVALAEESARAALAAGGIEPTEVALVTSVSCTGFMIPSLDAHLANRLPLSPDVRRLPLTLLGCAGGAMGLSHTVDLLAAHPRAVALLVAVELASLNLQEGDLSMPHLVSAALFGDGAAAVLIAGSESSIQAAGPRPRVTATRTRFFPDTLDAMGFDVRDTGFHMILDARIPALLDETIWPEVERFLADHGLMTRDVEHFLIHPGGRAILDVVEGRIGRALDLPRAVLRDHGNLSSVSVLLLLHELERSGAARAGDRGLMVAFGPGFNAEMVLLEWRE